MKTRNPEKKNKFNPTLRPYHATMGISRKPNPQESIPRTLIISIIETAGTMHNVEKTQKQVDTGYEYGNDDSIAEGMNQRGQ